MGNEKFKRPGDFRTTGDPDLLFDTERATVQATTAASTSLGPRGTFAITTTSTGAPVVYTLGDDFEAGDVLELAVDSLASSSDAPVHVNTGGALVGTSSADMIALSSVGAGCRLRAASTSRWLCVGNFGASFSTST